MEDACFKPQLTMQIKAPAHRLEVESPLIHREAVGVYIPSPKRNATRFQASNAVKPALPTTPLAS